MISAYRISGKHIKWFMGYYSRYPEILGRRQTDNFFKLKFIGYGMSRPKLNGIWDS